MRKLAVERQLEVIGQAANGISSEFREFMADIPWNQIIGLRNKLDHDYGEILTKRIWDIVQTSIEPLKHQIMAVSEIGIYLESHNVS